MVRKKNPLATAEILSAPPFTRRGIRHGFLRAQPLAWSVLLYGMMFGVLASSAALSALESLLMSALVYSGSAQMAALQGWSGAPQILPIVVTILIMNARYILYGAALRPWLGGLDAPRAYLSLFLLGDGNWALAMKERDAGDDDAGFLLGSGLVMFIGWTVGTLIGHLLGSLVARPELFGVDFLLTAFSAALMMGMFRGRRDLWPAIAAIFIAIAAAQFLGSGWVIVLSGLGAALIGYMTHVDRP